jgi:hypothetical protein
MYDVSMVYEYLGTMKDHNIILSRNGFQDLSWKSVPSSLWLEIRACVRACVRTNVYPPLTNFYFRLGLKPVSVWKVTMGAIAELQVDAFLKHTGNVFQSHRYVRATRTNGVATSR